MKIIRRHFMCRMTSAAMEELPHCSLGTWHPLQPRHLWDCPADSSYRTVGRSLNDVVERLDSHGTLREVPYLWFVYSDDGRSLRCVRGGKVRLTAERNRNPIRRGWIDWTQEPVRVFVDWIEWRPLNIDASQVPVTSDWLDGRALHLVDRNTWLWKVFEALVDIADAEEGQGVAGGGNRDAQQTMALSGATPGPSATFATAQPQMLAARSTPLSIEEREDKSFADLTFERKNPQVEGYVYLISMQRTQYYKIGMSLDPFSRLQTLQTGNPHMLCPVRDKRVPNMLEAESKLHRRFEAWRVPDTTAREWFKFSDKEILEKVGPAFDELTPVM